MKVCIKNTKIQHYGNVEFKHHLLQNDTGVTLELRH